MPGYAIIDALVMDDTHYEEYRRIARKTIAEFGGRYLVRGVPDVIEGSWPVGQRSVVLEFPSVARIREWYASPEYQKAVELRKGAMDIRLLVIEGEPN